MIERFDPATSAHRVILEGAEPGDLRYLFRYGVRIGEPQRRIRRFLAGYPPAKLRTLAGQLVHAYREGFRRNGKPLAGKKTCLVQFPAGMEMITRPLQFELRQMGLEAAVTADGAVTNRQYGFDHRLDQALYINEATCAVIEARMERAAAACAGLLEVCSGVFAVDMFGEAPFAPVRKEERIVPTPEQQPILQRHSSRRDEIFQKFYPRERSSFSMVAIPSPEIGEAFEAIFEDVLDMNMLDSASHEQIQQKLIDALDRAAYVRVRGRDGNQTDLVVALPDLVDPAKQTRFFNCGADINIPVGEVFTSPRLAGTTGLLHVEEAFLAGLRFVDLKLRFEDGYVREYGCGNFPDPEDGRKHVRETLLFPHETLPLGEFAIGTNTLAYAMAHRHRIVPVLPVLLVEKMGPHFAIGDTCFAHDEDRPVYNPDGKEVIARENEKSCRRREAPAEAYTQRHTDITLPFASIGAISVVLPTGGEIDLLREGRFVLAGTEELNGPLEGLSD